MPPIIHDSAYFTFFLINLRCGSISPKFYTWLVSKPQICLFSITVSRSITVWKNLQQAIQNCQQLLFSLSVCVIRCEYWPHITRVLQEHCITLFWVLQVSITILKCVLQEYWPHIKTLSYLTQKICTLTLPQELAVQNNTHRWWMQDIFRKNPPNPFLVIYKTFEITRKWTECMSPCKYLPIP